LAAFEGFDRPVSASDALAEMRALIEATDEPNAEQFELANTYETTWSQYRRDAAYGALGKIFEDIFQGAYYEAYKGLPDHQRKKLLELAAMTSRPGFQIDWILWELIDLSDAESIPIFHRFATQLDQDTSCPQEVVSAFLAAVEGCARLSDQPPTIPEDAKDDRRAWAIVGAILFWWMKGADRDSALNDIAHGWDTLRNEHSSSFPDILHNINHCQWRREKGVISLSSCFPDRVRPLLEDAVRNRENLTSLFRNGGSTDQRVLQTAILTLGDVGNEGSILALNDLADDSKFGRDAIRAIQAIRRRY
jgi:hypothetical protein